MPNGPESVEIKSWIILFRIRIVEANDKIRVSFALQYLNLRRSVSSETLFQ